MSVLKAIADELPLLAAIAHELGEDDGRNDVARLLEARQILQEAFHSVNHVPELEHAAA